MRDASKKLDIRLIPMNFVFPRTSPNSFRCSRKATKHGVSLGKSLLFVRFALPALLIGGCHATAMAQTETELRAAQPPAFATSSGVTSGPAPLPSVDSSSSLDTDEGGQPALPDAPNPQAAQTQPARNPSSKRIFGIIPNFRTVSTDVKLPPQTVKQKFTTATEDSFDYSAIFIPAALAGYSLGTTADPEFGGGGLGYARYLWHAAADQTSENFLVEAIVPTITHEDSRFYTLARGSVIKRTEYALTRAVVTRSDDGREVFNASEVFGSGISAGFSSFYYPTRERSFGNTGKQWGLDIGIDAIAFVVKEFAPDITQRFFTPKKSHQQ